MYALHGVAHARSCKGPLSSTSRLNPSSIGFDAQIPTQPITIIVISCPDLHAAIARIECMKPKNTDGLRHLPSSLNPKELPCNYPRGRVSLPRTASSSTLGIWSGSRSLEFPVSPFGVPCRIGFSLARVILLAHDQPQALAGPPCLRRD